MDQVLEILCHRERANSVLLLGEPGVGKTAIAEGLARRIEFEPETVPVRLRDCQIVNLQMNTMVAGTMLRGMFEDRIQNVIREIKERPNLILFIDEVHTMIGAGSALGAPSDAANVFKSVLARGEVRIIGATTLNEYKEFIQEDEALARRFRTVHVARTDDRGDAHDPLQPASAARTQLLGPHPGRSDRDRARDVAALHAPPAAARQGHRLARHGASSWRSSPPRVVSVGLTELYFSYQDSKRALTRVERDKASTAATSIEQLMQDARPASSRRSPSRRRRAGSAGLTERNQDFHRLLEREELVSELRYLDAAGKEQVRVDPARGRPHRQRDRPLAERRSSAARGRSSGISGRVYFQNGSQPHMTIAVAERGAGRGVVVADDRPRASSARSSTERAIGTAGYAYAVDSTRRAVAHPDIDLVLRHTNFASLPQVRGGAPRARGRHPPTR